MGINIVKKNNKITTNMDVQKYVFVSNLSFYHFDFEFQYFLIIQCMLNVEYQDPQVYSFASYSYSYTDATPKSCRVGRFNTESITNEGHTQVQKQLLKVRKTFYSTGPGPVDLAKKNPKNDIDICKVLMLVHLFPKYFEIIFLRSVCGSV